ncbi:putative transcriptional regulator [Lachnospiraceae bacterium PF1-22]|uniref:hypothetical protein n=1 Tax=Ohessyouella blattaphilus TaxID=2949333 RepID=UPI003E2933E4
MEPLINFDDELKNSDEEKLYEALDKGIDDMESGRTMDHEEAMAIIREKVRSYDV